jgi:hypothetical protein
MFFGSKIDFGRCPFFSFFFQPAFGVLSAPKSNQKVGFLVKIRAKSAPRGVLDRKSANPENRAIAWECC